MSLVVAKVIFGTDVDEPDHEFFAAAARSTGLTLCGTIASGGATSCTKFCDDPKGRGRH
jgi:hypothetical protein